MTNYKYRWIYGILLFVLFMMFGFYFILQPEQQALRASRKMEAQLKHVHLPALKPGMVTSAPVYQYQYVDALSMLFLSAHQTHIALQSVHLQSSLPAQDSVQMTATGHFHQLANFMLALQRQPILMIITDFFCHLLTTGELQLDMTVQLIKYGSSRQQLAVDQFDNTSSSFCTSDKALLNRQVDLSEVQNLPLAWLKMVAYLQQGSHVEAWIKLPNNGLISVTKADRIGREQGIVTQIRPEKIVLATTHGIQIIPSEHMNAH